jgi:hypothetical protein
VLGGEASWDEDPEALVRGHAEFLRRFVREQGVQTNEVQRSWMLLPCFLEAARRARAETVDLIELGPSAGLNLVWDRYRYVYDAGAWGPTASPLVLSGDERRRVPRDMLDVRLRVRSRVGVDRSPIDVTTDDGARLLKAFVWPDQAWRLELLDRAIEALRADPPELLRGDVVDELPGLLRARRADALTLVFQTVVLAYLDRDGVRRIYAALDEAAADGAPLAYVGTHAPAPDVHTYHSLALRVWPGERELVADADFHGAWIDWRLRAES